MGQLLKYDRFILETTKLRQVQPEKMLISLPCYVFLEKQQDQI